MVAATLEVARQRGVSIESLLGDEARSARPAEQWISLAEFQELMARAVQLTNEPALGVYCGLQASESNFGVMSPLVSHAPTLRHGIQLVTQFQGLLLEGGRIELHELGSIAQVLFEIGVPAGPSFIEFMLSGLLRKLRSFGCTQSDIRAVRFEYARPAHHEAYALAFGGAECFAQPFTGVEFDAQALDRPNLRRQPELQDLLRSHAESTLARLARPLNFIQRVRLAFRKLLKGPNVDMPSIARELGISVRSLRRRLEEEGTTFRELRQSALHEAACAMLRDPAPTMQSIAHDLGFADVTAFHHAFKRWNGLTPAEYRAAISGKRS